MSASPASESASAAHLIGEWARLVMATLLEAGVRDVWVSPGSRSTPFTWQAEQTPGLTLRAVVDERSAAFLALGQARATGRPSALLCTSGTAAAHYFPAIIEASLAHLPLVVLTADRPPEAQHAGASQTIDQLKLYGDHARAFFDLGPPDSAPAALAGVRRAVSQAVACSRGPVPGPVHLNLRARKPLEPAAPRAPAEHALSAQVSALLARPSLRFAPTQALANDAVLAAARTLSSAASGAIVVGPLPAFGPSLAEPIARLARLTGFPVLAEAASQVRFELAEHELACPLFDWLLSADVPSALPDVVLQLGQTPTSSAFERWAARVPTRVVLAQHGLPDALGSAALVASGDLEGGLAALIAELERQQHRAKPSEFSAQFCEAHARCEHLAAAALAEPAELMQEGAAVKSVVQALPDGALLALGNSLPIRDVDAYVARAAELRVTSQRGAAGIDGLVSGAIGSALGARVPTLLLLGDVSLLHDLGGLAAAGLVTVPLVLAVVDNQGGRIFDQLPVAELYRAQPAASRLWHTPPELDLERAAALFGLSYAAPTTPNEIRAAVTSALRRPGVTLLQLRVAPDSASRQRKQVLEALSGPAAETRG